MSARLHRLANGVRLAVDPQPELETLSLSVVVRGGSRWEDADRSGWSHLLEHMVFKGAGARDARQLAEAVEDAGGSINAATGHERTSFQVRTLKNGLPLAAEITSDLVFRPTLEAGELEREKGVIAQEIAEATDTPDDHVFELAQARAWGDVPLGRPILGTTGSIGTAQPDSLDEWRARLYAPERMVVSMAGAVDEDEALRVAEAWFGHAATSGMKGEPELAAFAGGAATESRRLEQAHLVLLLPGVGVRDPDYFAFRLFAEALGGGMSSRLFQRVREQRGLAYSIDSYAETYEDGGLLGVYAGTGGKSAAEAARVTAGQIAELAEHPGEAELRRAKTLLKSGLFMARESTLARAEQAAGQILLFNRVFTSHELSEAIEAVTLDDLRRVGARVLGVGRSAGAVLGPKAAAGAVEAFQAALPQGAAAR
ncbi:MAG: insulinase family protein [Proteobacteria bacterium]|nr:insulinase family protein [Pseudomonadota bacterium]